jgi:hypothetical protein
MYLSRLASVSMPSRLYRASVFALYQLTVLVGIAMLPVALAAEQVGLRIPLGRVIDWLGEAYDRADAA